MLKRTVEWHKLYNGKIGSRLSFSWKIMQKKDITKEYIWLPSYVTISVLYQAAILNFCKQNKNEASKLEKKTWNEFPVKNQLKKRYYKGIYVNFFVWYNF